MNIKVSEKKPGSGIDIKRYIGIWKGPLIAMNPDLAKLKELYNIEDTSEMEEPVYSGTKDGREWAQLCFIFQDEIQKVVLPYKIFLSKEVAEFEKDGVTKTYWINQYGDSQCVDDEKNLFESFTHLCKWDKDNGKFRPVDSNDEFTDNKSDMVKLSYRKAYKGEVALYSLLRKIVTQDWFQADGDTNLFIKIDNLMKGKLSDITSWIGSENYQSVVGCIEITAKDGENGTNYYQNCVDGAWMPGWKIKDANLATQTNTWSKYDDKANGKGKNRDIYQFYQSIKRNRNITELKPLHEFRPEDHLASSSDAIRTGDDTSVDMNYDI